MINRGKLWIIPNEEEIIQNVFVQNIESGKSHTQCIQEFSDIYQLDFKFGEEDYQTAPCVIASSGHMVIKSEDEVSLVICYLPEKVTDRQYNWLYQNKNMLDKYIQVNGFSLYNARLQKIHGTDQIMIEARKKNLLKEKGMKK